MPDLPLDDPPPTIDHAPLPTSAYPPAQPGPMGANCDERGHPFHPLRDGIPTRLTDVAERYYPLRFHARGGLGEVHIALDLELRRQVALKRLQERLAHDPDSYRRFLQEAEITGQLEHPGVVPVYGLVHGADNQPSYAMRFIEGESLQDAIKRFHSPRRAEAEPGLDLRHMLGCFVAVCNTLAYAHSRGIVHRDLKPANILLGKYGETLVVDWGLAKAFTRSDEEKTETAGSTPGPVLDVSQEASTQVGQTLGTPGFMSPEQAGGRAHLYGPASDIYSLGATLYTILTGRPPIQGKASDEVLQQIRQGDWQPPRLLNKPVPLALDAICCKALALEPRDRYASALELAADVDHWLADEPVSAWSEPWSARLYRWLGRHRTAVAGVAAAVLVAALSLAVATVLLQASGKRERAAKEDALRSGRQALSERDRAQLNLYVSQMNLAERAWDDAQVGRMLELLEGLRPKGDEVDLRGPEWDYLWRLCPATLLKGHERPASAVAFRPDGQILASAGYDKVVRIWSIPAGTELRALQGHTEPIRAISYDGDGRRLATASNDGTAAIWDPDAGKKLQTLKVQAGAVSAVALSPDGRFCVTGSEDKSARIWDAVTGAMLHDLAGHTSAIYGVAIGPRNRLVVTASLDGTARVWEAATGKLVSTYRGHGDKVRCAAFSPDGSLVATGGYDETIRLWNPLTAEEVLTLRGHTGPIWGIAFSPDGRRLATAAVDDTLRIWEAATGQELLAIHGQGGWLTGVAVSADGRRIASCSHSGTIRLYDARPPRPDEVETRRDALAMVRSLFATPLPRDEVVTRLRQDQALSDAVRQEAEALAKHYPEHPLRLNNASWGIVSRADATLDEYRLALRQSEAACRLVPPEGFYLNTLGVAQYRNGKYAEALESLSRADRFHNAQNGESIPEDLAFLAMSNYKLGRHQQALEYYRRLRESVQKPQWAANEDTQAFLKEVQALLGPGAP